jgi:hypothetical protein
MTLKVEEALTLFKILTKSSGNPIQVLMDLLPRMSSSEEARLLINKSLNADLTSLRSLASRMGHLFHVIMGIPNGFYRLNVADNRKITTATATGTGKSGSEAATATAEGLGSSDDYNEALHVGNTAGDSNDDPASQSNEAGQTAESLDRECLRRLLQLSEQAAATRRKAGLGDLSQHAEWSSFRNVTVNGIPLVPEPIDTSLIEELHHQEMAMSTVPVIRSFHEYFRGIIQSTGESMDYSGEDGLASGGAGGSTSASSSSSSSAGADGISASLKAAIDPASIFCPIGRKDFFLEFDFSWISKHQSGGSTGLR